MGGGNDVGHASPDSFTMAIFSCPALTAWLRTFAFHLGRPHQQRSDHRSAEISGKRDRYRAAVGALPAEIRTIYLLHRADGLSIGQIAERIGRPSTEIEQDIAEAIFAIWRALDGDRI